MRHCFAPMGNGSNTLAKHMWVMLPFRYESLQKRNVCMYLYMVHGHSITFLSTLTRVCNNIYDHMLYAMQTICLNVLYLHNIVLLIHITSNIPCSSILLISNKTLILNRKKEKHVPNINISSKHNTKGT